MMYFQSSRFSTYIVGISRSLYILSKLWTIYIFNMYKSTIISWKRIIIQHKMGFHATLIEGNLTADCIPSHFYKKLHYIPLKLQNQ